MSNYEVYDLFYMILYFLIGHQTLSKNILQLFWVALY